MRLLIVILLLSTASFADTKVIFADKVLVKKQQRKLFLLKNGKPFRKYSISLGDSPRGPKQQQGDEKTPEGLYVIDYRNPKSSYTLSLHISYPDKNDRLLAKKRGVNPGGEIFIHGSPNGMSAAEPGLTKIDWTDGCIAVKNKDIKEIWKLVKNGTPIEIQP